MRLGIRRTIRSVWISFGVALLVLALLDGVARIAIAVIARRPVAPELAPIDVRLRGDDPAGPDWAEGYRREFEQSLQQVEWHPYVYWRAKPYRGRYINVDEAGLRRTWNTTRSPAPDQLRIFMFGGSTMLGLGARDEFTIPSLVSKKLTNRLAAGVWVTNFGESGYVNTQEVMALMLELQRGNVPDIVVFYDGVNDAFSAFESRVAGIPHNERGRVAEFNSRRYLNWRGGLVERTGLYSLTRRVVRVIGRSRSGGRDGKRTPQTESLANAVMDVYLGNVRIVDSLAARFGFQAVFFWQPTVFTKSRLSSQEQRYERSERASGRVKPFFGEVYKAFKRRMGTDKIDNVHDLSGVFGEPAGTIFIDQFHVSEAGNDRVAEEMVRVLQEVARRRKR